MQLTYEQHEMRSLQFDSLQNQVPALRKRLEGAREDQQTAARYAQEWEADAQNAEYGEVARLNFRRAANEWKGREARAAAEVARLEKQLADLNLRVSTYWE